MFGFGDTHSEKSMTVQFNRYILMQYCCRSLISSTACLRLLHYLLRQLRSHMFVLLLCSFIPRAFYRYRWKFLHPLARPLISLPGRHRPLTIGETVMLVIIAGATIGLAAATWGLKLEQITSTGKCVYQDPLRLPTTLSRLWLQADSARLCKERMQQQHSIPIKSWHVRFPDAISHVCLF